MVFWGKPMINENYCNINLKPSELCNKRFDTGYEFRLYLEAFSPRFPTYKLKTIFANPYFYRIKNFYFLCSKMCIRKSYATS